MLLQETPGDEPFTAIWTLIRPLSRMISEMQDQRGPLRKSFTALLTHVRFFARMNPPVNPEIFFARKFLLAEIALRYLLVYVPPPVHHQPSLRGENGAAEIAQMFRLFAHSVQPSHVPLQQYLLRVSLQANRAHVLPDRRQVSGQRVRVLTFEMHRQILLVRIRLFAMLALEELYSRVNVHVFHVLCLQNESFVAVLAPEAVVLRVPSTMTIEIGLLIRRVIA